MECRHKGCDQKALHASQWCWEHLQDKGDYLRSLERSIAAGADLGGANLKRIVLNNARLEKADMARACLSQADISGSHLFDVNLEGADLVGTNLSDCDMTHCNLRHADMTKAVMRQARFWNSDMTGANLSESDLEGADMWNAKLYDVKLWHASFGSAKSISQTSFYATGRFSKARISEAGELSAEESYRSLKQYFSACGKYNDASWASYREKTMERISLLKRRSPEYLPSLLMSLLCGYGEKPSRIVFSALGCILLFAALYSFLGSIVSSSDPAYRLNWFDYLYYSTITYTTVGYGDFIPKANCLFRLLAASEAFIGVFLAGLFVFTLARKYSAR